MRRHSNGFFKFILYIVFPVVILSILIISFFAFKKLALPYDVILKDGKRLSVFAAEVRSELLKRSDLTSVVFSSKDGIRLSGYLVKRRGAIGNIVIAHGYQSCKEKARDLIDLFTDYNLLLFDFRAHGKSGGRFRTLGCHEYKDLFAAVDFLKGNTKQKGCYSKSLPTFVLGISMGGAVAIDALKRDSNLCDGLVVEAAFADLNKVIYGALKKKSRLPAYPFAPVLIRMANYVADCSMNDVSIIDGIDKIKQPIFFIHSCNDVIVDVNDSVNMYTRVLSKKSKIWITPPCVHARAHKEFPITFKKKIDKFFKRNIS